MSEMMFYAVAFFFGIGVITTIRWIHTASEKWKSTVSLILMVVSIIVGPNLYEWGKDADVIGPIAEDPPVIFASQDDHLAKKIELLTVHQETLLARIDSLLKKN